MSLPRRVADLLGVALPVLQAPMAGTSGVRLAVAAAEAGGLSALPCAMLSADQIRESVQSFRQQLSAPINLNFFTHAPPQADPAREAAWRARLAPFAHELGVTGDAPAASRAPFDAAMCAVVEELKPEVVSFHFGLPAPELVARVRAAGPKVLSSATTLAEALWLEARGVDAIIAQGVEAGGHRGMFLSEDISTQMGTMALVQLIAGRVRVPVIAAGAIADGRSAAAALLLGADAVQIGTALMRAPECDTAPLHRALLEAPGETALTNLFTGRPARGLVNRIMRELGPMNPAAPAFPNAAIAMAPLRRAAEARGDAGFSPLWAGQAFPLARAAPAGEIVRALCADAEKLLAGAPL